MRTITVNSTLSYEDKSGKTYSQAVSSQVQVEERKIGATQAISSLFRMISNG